MGAITYDRIRIEGGLGLTRLLNLRFQVEANRHASAVIEGIVDQEVCMQHFTQSLETHVVKIIIQEEDGSDPRQPIFSGYLKDAEIFDEAGYCTVRMTLYSGTIALDREKKSRSYQDISKSYADIVQETVEGYHVSQVIPLEGNESHPSRPVIQYLETDWEFALRMAGHLHAAIYPEVRQPYPRYWLGIPGLSETKELTDVEYTIGISSRYHELGGSQAGYAKEDFLYYDLKTYENYEISTKIRFKGGCWPILRKSATMQDNQLVFVYRICRPELIRLKKVYNPVFAGMTLLGTVLSAKNETLRLHLRIDPQQDEGTAYDYEWTPDTGSTMYCMPKVGTTVSLYFSSEDEWSGRATNCIRTNGGGGKNSSPDMSDPSKRCLTTEHGKKMYLNPGAMGFVNEKAGHSLVLDDGAGISLESGKPISISGQSEVRIVGKKVVLETPTEFKMESS